MNKLEQGVGFDPESAKRGDEFFVIRHSIAQYKDNQAIIHSDNPEGGLDPADQEPRSDLTQEGEQLAREEAEKFFDNLDPEKDALFFVSSRLTRTINTANVYREVAKERGFEIIRPENVRDDRLEEMGEGDVRALDSLTLNIKNMLIDFVFFPNDQLEDEVRDENLVSAETREKWRQARAIIESDNQGTWGDNYCKHSDEIKKIFPGIKTAEDMYNRKLKPMVKMMKMAQEKMNAEQPEKDIKVLAFTHENLLIHFLDKNFNEGRIANCEGVAFKIDGPDIEATAKGETKKVEI